MTLHAPQHSGQRLTLALTALCVTQIVGWGVLYYALPVALSTISRDTGWHTTTITAAFAVALLTSAAAGIPAGRSSIATDPDRS